MFLAMTETTLTEVVKPIIEICEATLPILISIVGAIGALYCVILGVKFARADDPQEHEKAKNSLKYAVIGFILIFVLLIMLRIGSSVFLKYYQESIKSYK